MNGDLGWSGKVPHCGCLLEWVSPVDPDYLTRRLTAWRAMGYEPVQVTHAEFMAQMPAASGCSHGRSR